MNKSQSKYFRTAIKMDEALLTLLTRKEFRYITVKEICEQAGVNRSTFYLHYETMTDLLSESIRYMHEKFQQSFSELHPFTQNVALCPEEQLLLITPQYLQPYLAFVKENHLVYRAAIDYPETFSAQETYERLYQHIFEPILQRFSIEASERAYIIHFYLGGIAAVVEQWMKNDCADPMETIMAVIQKCIPGYDTWQKKHSD